MNVLIENIFVTLLRPLFWTSLAMALIARPAPAATRPNVIVILTDDLGYHDLGVQGATDIKTPNLDALARDGVRFTSGYVTAPLSSPSRAGLITGRYLLHQRHRRAHSRQRLAQHSVARIQDPAL